MISATAVPEVTAHSMLPRQGDAGCFDNSCDGMETPTESGQDLRLLGVRTPSGVSANGLAARRKAR